MISIKLRRDEARVLEETFLPYMIKIAVLCVGNVESMSADYLHWKMMVSLLHDVNLVFKRKLLLPKNKFNFKFSEAHAIAFFGMLMKKPVDAELVWINLMRQRICNEIHQQLLNPVEEMEVYPHH